MAENLPNLLTVIQAMDPKDVAAIASIHLVSAADGYQASFTFARWTRSASKHGGSKDWGRTEYEPQTIAAVHLDSREPIANQLGAVQDSGMVGNLDTARFRPHSPEDDSRESCEVKTHAGSDSERVEWLRSLRD